MKLIPGSASMGARDSISSRCVGYASHRSAPVASSRSRSPVFSSKRDPYASHFPSGLSVGRTAEP